MASADESQALPRMTVFGPSTPATSAVIEQQVLLLYGELKLSDKDQAKIQKDLKFKAKLVKQQAKAEAAPSKKKAAKEAKAEDTFDYVPPPKGEKKAMSLATLAPKYDPKIVEDGWYDWWLREGFFKPEYAEKHPMPGAAGSFTIVIPPPNVTGTLHLGHALTTAIEDAITRWHRMSGKRTLWNPGCDHAGIATQAVVEKKIWRERKQTRHDLGREAFLAEVWKWKEQSGGRIYEQLKGLGASCDWDREAFTMSERCCRAVEQSFIELHRKGLIYRSDRLVNWSCQLQSAISDIEVDKTELTGRTMVSVPGYTEQIEFGVLIKFAYKIEGSDEEIIVATTRIETMLGDVAVAVHPDDPRYKKFAGKKLIHPFCDRKLDLVFDPILVDMSYGTGAVKVTPAHDENDYECGKRHNLPMVVMIQKDGTISPGFGEFSGMPRFKCRQVIQQRLEAKGLLRGKSDNPMVLPTCSRSKDVIEPLPVPQWFCDCSGMAAKAVKAVKEGSLRLIPDSFNKIWFHWLDNIRPWCISRQLWWGHRIPAYFVTIQGQPEAPTTSNEHWISARSEAEALEQAAARFKVDKSKISLRQDEDVLDTWFSSGIYPISCFSWPDTKCEDFLKYYPGNLLETGHDILFFWVARMVMMCEELTGKLPFTEVYLHSIVRDAHGRKMSKSLGNVVDPLDVRSGITLEKMTEKLKEGNLDPKEFEKASRGQKSDYPDGIPECGVDALRFALCNFSEPGKDINLNVARIHGYRKFCNKIWQAVRLTLSNLGPDYVPSPADPLAHPATDPALQAANKWMLSRLSFTIAEVNAGFTAFDFPRLTTAIFNLVLYDFCDFYLELTKPYFRTDKKEDIASIRHIQYLCVDSFLRMASPMMPFVTEELWQALPRLPGEHAPSVCVAAMPTAGKWADAAAEAAFETAKVVKTHILSVANEVGLNVTKNLDVFYKTSNEATLKDLSLFLEIVITLTNVKSLKIVPAAEAFPPGTLTDPRGDCILGININGLLDPAKELERLADRRGKLESEVAALAQRSSAADYAKRPEDVRQRDAEKLAKMREELQVIERSEVIFRAMK